MGLMGASDEALAQLGVAENEAQREQTKKSAITSLAQLNQEVAEDEMGRGSSEAVIEDAFSSAMQDYIEQARGAGPKTKELSLNDYKKGSEKSVRIRLVIILSILVSLFLLFFFIPL